MLPANARPTPSQDPSGALLLERQLCFPIYAASHLLNRLYRPLLAELGLTYPQYLVMLALWQGGPQGVGALGRRLHLDSGTLTPLLKRLEQAGLVTRRRSAPDERRVLIELTERGAALRQQALRIPRTLAEGIRLPSGQAETLRTQLQSLVELLSEHLQHPQQPTEVSP